MAGLTYRGAPSEALRIVPLDGLTLVYHRASGITHLLAPPAPELLAVLSAGEADIDTLMERIAADYTVEEGGIEELRARLAELLEAGLIELI